MKKRISILLFSFILVLTAFSTPLNAASNQAKSIMGFYSITLTSPTIKSNGITFKNNQSIPIKFRVNNASSMKVSAQVFITSKKYTNYSAEEKNAKVNKWLSLKKSSTHTYSSSLSIKNLPAGTYWLHLTVFDEGYGKDFCEKYIKLNVKSSKPILSKGVKLNRNSLSLSVRKSYTLKTTIAPLNTTNKKITWTTSNKKIAIVSQKGVVKALKKGTAVITAKTSNGKKATCIVRVK